VRVAGVPLVERVGRNLVAAGARSLTVIFNGEEADCAAHLRERFGDVEVRIVLKTTASSLESLREVLERMPPGRALVSTVDTVTDEASFVAFVREAERLEGDATVLAVTPLVADEKPLWAEVGDDGRIAALGGRSGNCVTAGVYLFSGRARELARGADLPRLRDFLASLVAEGESMYGLPIREVVDVDRAEDVALAEALISRTGAR
jgi:NDP-sugar pyrophosphorylase family protein